MKGLSGSILLSIRKFNLNLAEANKVLGVIGDGSPGKVGAEDLRLVLEFQNHI